MSQQANENLYLPFPLLLVLVEIPLSEYLSIFGTKILVPGRTIPCSQIEVDGMEVERLIRGSNTFNLIGMIHIAVAEEMKITKIEPRVDW